VLRVVNIVGTRPNLVKMAAVLRAQQSRPDIFVPRLVHTGQHQDPAMSGRLFTELELPDPDVVLDPSSGGHAAQVGHMLAKLETVLVELRPDLVVVVGDVNSTAAGALAAAAAGIPVAHIEAGLRSFDRSMPEELNRVVVDTISDYLFASETSGVENLQREGRPSASIFHVGNVMIDALVRFWPRAVQRNPAAQFGISRLYGVLTLHRPSNVDQRGILGSLLSAIAKISRHLPIIFPMHPRTRDRIDTFGFGTALGSLRGVHVTSPLGYLDMLALMNRARLVLTDSGGVQEETTFLGVPCLTLRNTTERPATVHQGTNRIIGARPERIPFEVQRILDGDTPAPRCPPLWDGRAAERVAEILAGGSGVVAASG